MSARGSVLLAATAALALVSLACGSAPARLADPPPTGPEAGGDANGTFVDRGEETPLRHAYAVPVRPRRATQEELHLVLSDRPVPQEALDDLRSLAGLARNGELRAVEIVVGSDGRAIRTEFHHDGLPAGLAVLGAPKGLTATGLPDGPISGSFVFDEPAEYSWSARGSFETPVYRPDRPAAMPAVDASPAERARARLADDGFEWREDVFLDRAFDGDAEAVALFLEGGMSPSTRSGRGSALGDALSQKHLEVVTLLLAAGADPNEKVDDYGTTHLHHAVDTGEVAFVAALLEAKANPSAANQYRITPLMSASLEGRLEMVKLLVAHGAKVTARDTSGGTALSSAVFRGHLEVAKFLIASGADVRRDKTDLIALARQSKNTAMERLIREAAAAAPAQGSKPKP